MKDWQANLVFRPVGHQITDPLACHWLAFVDISSPGGKPELIAPKGWFNNNQILEDGRQEHTDPTQSKKESLNVVHTANKGHSCRPHCQQGPLLQPKVS